MGYLGRNYVDALTGSVHTIHMGQGLHAGVAWVVLYNFLASITNICQGNDEEGLSPMRMAHEAKDLINFTPYESFGMAKNATTDFSILDKYATHSSPVKFMSSLKRDTKGPEGVNSDWKKELVARDEACKSKDANPEICSYAWMVGLAEVTSTDGVTSALQGYLKHNNGWNASMLPVDKPRVGWFALIEKASFSLAITVNTDTNYVTVLSLVSYGPNFVGTNLNLSIKVYEGGGSFAQNKSNSESLYDISGYHETKSSIDVPHKFKLQQGARKGDVVEIKGTLTSGAHFRISGLALCRL